MVAAFVVYWKDCNSRSSSDFIRQIEEMKVRFKSAVISNEERMRNLLVGKDFSSFFVEMTTRKSDVSEDWATDESAFAH